MREMRVLPTVTLPLFSQAQDMTPFIGRKTAADSRDPELTLLSARVSWEADPLCWSQSGSASWLYVYLPKCLGPSDLSSVSALVSSETIWWSCDLLIHVPSSAWHLSFLYCDIINVIEQSDSVFLKVLSLFY